MSPALDATLTLPEEDVYAEFCKREWCDGLPFVPPTAERVGAMRAGARAEPAVTLGLMPPLWRECTIEKLAVNAVMAGCEPAYFPVVVAAVRAMLDPAFNLYGVQATTHPVAPLVVVSGPYARTIGMHAGSGLFGPGFRANATIGRAIRLILMNVGGGWPGRGDMATQGSPAKFAYAIAEREDATPWEPLHVALGFEAEQSAVTVFGG
ncbi:MAG: UGSC family (seleno)protein, partial [Candidatus Rokuibacteriota bacterium]